MTKMARMTEMAMVRAADMVLGGIFAGVGCGGLRLWVWMVVSLGGKRGGYKYKFEVR